MLDQRRPGVASETGAAATSHHAESGEGLGADAQAGWTALVANLIAEGWPGD